MNVSPKLNDRNVSLKLNDESSQVLQMEMEEITESFLPSKHSLFLTIANLSTSQLSKANRWNALTLEYESAIRGIRHGEALVPHLVEEGMAEIKEFSGHSEIFFRRVSEKLSASDAKALAREPRPQTQRFIRAMKHWYASGLGAWCFVGMVQKDWLSAFERSLMPHFFGHGLRAEMHSVIKTCLPRYTPFMVLNATALTVSHHPRMLKDTLKQAREMAALLDNLWDDFQSLLLEPPSSSRA